MFDSDCSTEHTTVAVPCSPGPLHVTTDTGGDGFWRHGDSAGCELHMATPANWQLQHLITAERKYFPELIELIAEENITDEDEDDNGLSMTAAAARDKDSFCWRPWHGCCALRGWSPPRPATRRKAGGKAEDEGCSC